MLPGDDRHPALSVVIPLPAPEPALPECLAALGAGEEVEVLVVDGAAAADPVGERFPHVRVLPVPDGASLPRLRGLGIAEARGAVVGLLDPWCIPAPGWAAEAVRVHRERPEPAAGGPVALDEGLRPELVTRAAYLFDYWEFVPPMAGGPAAALAGNNITYKRQVLGSPDALRRDGFWKAFVNERLLAEGGTLLAVPALAVTLRRRVGAGAFLRSRFHHGRSYAAMRVTGAPWRTRLLRALSAPLLPALFVLRQARGLMSKPGWRRWFVTCLPLLVLFHVAWAWGELCGYLAGPGRSHDAVRG